MAAHRPTPLIWRRFTQAVLAVALTAAQGSTAQSADASTESGSTATTTGYYTPLGDLTTQVPTKPIGGMNFTRCCLSAVNDWRDGSSGSDVVVRYGEFSTNPKLIFTPESLAQQAPQFPCGASFSGDDNGAPEVLVTFSWCQSNCGGWEQSTNADLAQWIIPFVGFILPAAVFCLNVPRRLIFDFTFENPFPVHTGSFEEAWLALWRYTVGRGVEEKRTLRGFLLKCGTTLNNTDFREGWFDLWHYSVDEEKKKERTFWGWTGRFAAAFLSTLANLILTVLRAAVALSLGLANVVGWVVIVFSAATPMILSGLYEAALDRQVLDAIDREIRHHRQDPEGETNISFQLPDAGRIRYHVHLLYAVLVGNLELWHISPEEPKPTKGNKHPKIPPPDSDAWTDVQKLVEHLDPSSTAHMVNTRTRLQTMLQCQASFGATVAAPIAFFLGAFLLSVESNVSAYGNNDDSHTLAFGEWWMTIPHVAIVSGCLLAGNNPNTLEAIYSGIKTAFEPERDIEKIRSRSVAGPPEIGATPQPPPKRNARLVLQSLRKNFFSPFYDSWYQPVWMWERGRSKRNWIAAVQEERLAALLDEQRQRRINHPQQQGGGGVLAPPSDLDTDNEQTQPQQLAQLADAPAKAAKKTVDRLRRLWEVSKLQHKCKDIPSMGLVGWVLLVLTGAVLVVVPMVLAYVTSYYTPTVGLSCRTFTYVLYFVCQIWLAALWLADFPRLAQRGLVLLLSSDQTKPAASASAKLLAVGFLLAVAVGFAGSAFSAVAGTFMQVLGVYRNCQCSVPIGNWGDPTFAFLVSDNAASMIYYAQRYWLGTGIASIVLLLIFCYMGWWYQRHWRQRFADVVSEVLRLEELLATTAGGAVERERPSAAPAAGGAVAEGKAGEPAVRASEVVSPGESDEITPVQQAQQEEPKEAASPA